jgi:hypothetical protein
LSTRLSAGMVESTTVSVTFIWLAAAVGELAGAVWVAVWLNAVRAPPAVTQSNSAQLRSAVLAFDTDAFLFVEAKYNRPKFRTRLTYVESFNSMSHHTADSQQL